MPPQIPSPIMVGGTGRQRLGVAQQLLEAFGRSLIQSTAFGLGRQLMDETIGPDEAPASRQRAAQEEVAQSQLRQSGQGEESTILRQASPFRGGTEEEAAQAVERVEDLRQTAPERFRLLQDQQAEEEKAAAWQTLLDTMKQRRQQAISQFGAEAPEVQEINREITALQAKQAAMTAGLGADERQRLQNQIAPDLETRLENGRMRIALRRMQDPGFDFSQIIRQGDEAAAGDLIAIEELGLGQTYRALVEDQAAADRIVRSRAATLSQQTSEAGQPIPVAQMEQILRTGEAPSDRAQEFLDQNRAQIRLERRTTRFGLVDRALDQPAAQVLMSQMQTAIEEGQEDKARDAYNRMRRLLIGMPGLDGGVVRDFFPSARVVGQGGFKAGARRLFGHIPGVEEGPDAPGLVFTSSGAKAAGGLLNASDNNLDSAVELGQSALDRLRGLDTEDPEVRKRIDRIRSAIQVLKDAKAGRGQQ